ncbi:Trehalose-6-P synthase/phosphatase complex subunit, partial [Spiromyces aspiralis]
MHSTSLDSRVLVVGLFAPYTVTFDDNLSSDLSASPPSATSSSSPTSLPSIVPTGTSILHSRAFLQGRRSSVHRSAVHPLDRDSQKHSLRRSSYSRRSIESFELQSRAVNNGETSHVQPINPRRNPAIHVVSLEPHNEREETNSAGNGNDVRAMHPPQRRSGPVPRDHAIGNGSSGIDSMDASAQLAHRLDRAAGINTPPPTSLNYSRQETLDQLPRQARCSGGDPIIAPPNQHRRSPPFTSSFGSTWGKMYGTEKSGPFVVEQLNISNIGLFNAVNSSLDIISERIWVGTPGVPTETWSSERRAEISATLLDEFETVPIYVNNLDLERHYNLFCKQLLWPLFHYIPPEMPKWHGWERCAYEAAVAVSQQFADQIAKFYRPGDVIWVNDYHLMLLPQMLRQRLPSAKIGFFMHIPFPSSEILRCLHVRKQLLNGILAADVIGFQTFSYSRHFIQTCQRVLGLEGLPGGLIAGDRTVTVGQFPIGLDPLTLAQKRDSPEVRELIRFLESKYRGKKLIVGRDKLDYVKGVRQKLLAFEMFLDKFPEHRENTIMIQVALTTAEHNETQVAVIDVVSRINAKYGSIQHQPVVFLHQDIQYSHYLALLSVADALLVTSLRDGMNLTSHEYVLCQNHKHSPLIM